MTFYGHFKPHGSGLIRLDTRIYLNSKPSCKNEGVCVGGFVGKNPGSATGAINEWGPLLEDPTLKQVGQCFLDAYFLAKLKPPGLAYVQVWNLFYWCNPKFTVALTECDPAKVERCETESKRPHVVWFGWGRPKGKLCALETRFQNIPAESSFYFDWTTKQLKDGRPSKDVCAKHPLRWNPEPIIAHLAKKLGNQCP